MEYLREALELLLQAFGNAGLQDPVQVFKEIWGGTTLERVRNTSYNSTTVSKNKIKIRDLTFKGWDDDAKEVTDENRDTLHIYRTFIHELAHVWDRRTGRDLADGLMEAVGGSYEHNFLFWQWGAYSTPDNSPYAGEKDHFEDFAWTFATFVVYPEYDFSPERESYIEEAIQNLE